MSEYHCPVCGAEMFYKDGLYKCTNCGLILDHYEVEENGIV